MDKRIIIPLLGIGISIPIYMLYTSKAEKEMFEEAKEENKRKIIDLKEKEKEYPSIGIFRNIIKMFKKEEIDIGHPLVGAFGDEIYVNGERLLFRDLEKYLDKRRSLPLHLDKLLGRSKVLTTTKEKDKYLLNIK